MNNRFPRVAAAVASALLPVFCFASGEAGTFLSGMNQELEGVRTNVRTVVMVVIGVIALVFAAINLVKYLRGDGQSQNALIRVVVGVAMALVVVAMAFLI